MDAMSSTISSNLKLIRKEKRLSLDTVSEMTGVSKSMLGQIERGESSPTVATLWKIATGLHISFTALLERKERDTEIILKDDVIPLCSDEGHFRIYPFFPFDDGRRFEMLSIELDKGCISQSAAHEDGTEEFMLVTEGSVRLTVGDVQYVIKEGNAIRYIADKPHVYANAGSTTAKLCMVIYYKK